MENSRRPEKRNASKIKAAEKISIRFNLNFRIKIPLISLQGSAKISEPKTRQIIEYFALDLTAKKPLNWLQLTHQSVYRIYLKIRNRIAEECRLASPFSSCQIEVDESYFGVCRARGKRGVKQAVNEIF